MLISGCGALIALASAANLGARSGAGEAIVMAGGARRPSRPRGMRIPRTRLGDKDRNVYTGRRKAQLARASPLRPPHPLSAKIGRKDFRRRMRPQLCNEYLGFASRPQGRVIVWPLCWGLMDTMPSRSARRQRRSFKACVGLAWDPARGTFATYAGQRL